MGDPHAARIPASQGPTEIRDVKLAGAVGALSSSRVRFLE
jgi:hypothetical protein